MGVLLIPAPASLVDEQRRRAAARATEVRSRRAAAKRAIAAGEKDLAAILRTLEIDDVVDQIPVWQLLRSVPGIGPTTASEILTEISIDGQRRPLDLDLDDRGAIADAIERRGIDG